METKHIISSELISEILNFKLEPYAKTKKYSYGTYIRVRNVDSSKNVEWEEIEIPINQVANACVKWALNKHCIVLSSTEYEDIFSECQKILDDNKSIT